MPVLWKRVSAHPSRGLARGGESIGQVLLGQNPVSSWLEQKRLQASGNINRQPRVGQLKSKRCIAEDPGDSRAKKCLDKQACRFPSQICEVLSQLPEKRREGDPTADIEELALGLAAAVSGSLYIAVGGCETVGVEDQRVGPQKDGEQLPSETDLKTGLTET